MPYSAPLGKTRSQTPSFDFFWVRLFYSFFPNNFHLLVFKAQNCFLLPPSAALGNSLEVNGFPQMSESSAKPIRHFSDRPSHPRFVCSPLLPALGKFHPFCAITESHTSGSCNLLPTFVLCWRSQADSHPTCTAFSARNDSDDNSCSSFTGLTQHSGQQNPTDTTTLVAWKASGTEHRR